jgi:hypothetical protein
MNDVRKPTSTFDRIRKEYSGKKFSTLKIPTNSENNIKGHLALGIPLVYENNYYFKSEMMVQRKLMKSIGAETIVNVRYGNFSDPYEYAFNRQIKTISFGDYFLNHFINKNKDYHYFGNYSLTKENLNALKIQKPDIFSHEDFASGQLWVGEKGCVTPLHCDGGDNFIYQLYGEKRWVLFPPSDYENLYIDLNAGFPMADFICSTIDVANVDLKKHPKFKRVNSIEISLKAGESLYLPYGWFHYVETIRDSVTVNFWVVNKELTPFVRK